MLDQQAVQGRLVRVALYDWSTSDIWHANYRFGYDYNRLYDLYYMAGLKPSQMRVASPFNDYSKDSLNLYRVIDPEVWTSWWGACRRDLPRSTAIPRRWLPEHHASRGAHMEILHPVPAGHTARPPAQQLRQKIQNVHPVWHETGGGLDEAVIRELEAHGYPILRNGVSNYTRDKKSRIIFTGPIPDDTDDIKSSKDIPSWKRMCYCILKNDHNCRFMGFG